MRVAGVDFVWQWHILKAVRLVSTCSQNMFIELVVLVSSCKTINIVFYESNGQIAKTRE
eukprot:jgi/Antlo1/448/1778